MSHPIPATDQARRESAKRQARADRILDAAAELILRWGYNKTTVDDIARRAGVAKGTIYLHWRTRDELFAALIDRERLELAADVRQRMAADPAGATLRGMLKHTALALLKRPLLKAVMVGDQELLGRLAQTDASHALYRERTANYRVYLEFLRQHGFVRTDLSLEAQVYMMSAVFMGYFMVAPLMPDELAPSDEQKVELMAETIHRTLETDRALDGDDLRELAAAFARFLDRATSLVQERLHQEADVPDEGTM